jgi:hypothetical protein
MGGLPWPGLITGTLGPSRRYQGLPWSFCTAALVLLSIKSRVSLNPRQDERHHAGEV